jgi:hypothetical protein
LDFLKSHAGFAPECLSGRTDVNKAVTKIVEVSTCRADVVWSFELGTCHIAKILAKLLFVAFKGPVD